MKRNSSEDDDEDDPGTKKSRRIRPLICIAIIITLALPTHGIFGLGVDMRDICLSVDVSGDLTVQEAKIVTGLKRPDFIEKRSSMAEPGEAADTGRKTVTNGARLLALFGMRLAMGVARDLRNALEEYLKRALPPEAPAEPSGDSVPAPAEPETLPENKEEPRTNADAGGSGFPIRYADDTLELTVTKEWYVGAWCYIAHIRTSDYSRFGTDIAAGGYGSRETVSSFQKRCGSVLTVNGDYAEGYSLGVIRGGRVYRDGHCTAQAIYSQRTGLFCGERNDMTLSELAAQGYTDTFEFTPAQLVVDGVSVYGRKDGGKSAQRTLIGWGDAPGDIYLIVTEGRYSDGVSRGLQYYEAGDLIASLGCRSGLALDGGGSSEMMFMGRILNSVSERRVTGFIYVK